MTQAGGAVTCASVCVLWFVVAVADGANARGAEPRNVCGSAELALHAYPGALDAASRFAIEYRGEAPYQLTARYSWGREGSVGLDVPAGVHAMSHPFTAGFARLRATVFQGRGQARGFGLSSRGIVTDDLTAKQPASTPEDPTADADGMVYDPVLGAPLAGLMLLSDPTKLTIEDLGPEQLDGVTVHKLRVVPPEPVRIYEPHRLATFLVWRDEGRGLVLRVEGYDVEGKLAAETVCSQVTEVAPGKWAALRVEERFEPGVMRWNLESTTQRGDQPPVTEIIPEEAPVGGASEVIELAVIAEGLVMPKQISHYDDQGRLLMHMRFLSYEIEYEDGTVVYAEP